MTIQPGQTYRSVAPIPDHPGNYRYIKILGEPMTIPGVYGFGTVQVATLTEDGRETRQRSMKLNQLHATATTRDGVPRRTGYVLEDT
ncbi:hypothetical protein ACFWAF_03045 [Streptomyces microflavus]|uniref:hypothetical protein n=1 Tax=Streptomyces microflavus TaxID=1919 RepID=UPI00364EA744